jgi:hypothetical protein
MNIKAVENGRLNAKRAQLFKMGDTLPERLRESPFLTLWTKPADRARKTHMRAEFSAIVPVVDSSTWTRSRIKS